MPLELTGLFDDCQFSLEIWSIVCFLPLEVIVSNCELLDAFEIGGESCFLVVIVGRVWGILFCILVDQRVRG